MFVHNHLYYNILFEIGHYQKASIQDFGSYEHCGWWQFRTSCSTSTSSRRRPPSGKATHLLDTSLSHPWTPCTVVALALRAQLSPKRFWHNYDQKSSGTIMTNNVLAQLWPKVSLHNCDHRRNPCDPHIKRDVSLPVTQIGGGTLEGVWGAHQRVWPQTTPKSPL